MMLAQSVDILAPFAPTNEAAYRASVLRTEAAVVALTGERAWSRTLRVAMTFAPHATAAATCRASSKSRIGKIGRVADALGRRWRHLDKSEKLQKEGERDILHAAPSDAPSHSRTTRTVARCRRSLNAVSLTASRR